MNKPGQHTAKFKMLNRIFWLLWCLLFITSALIIRELIDPLTYTAGLTEVQKACFESIKIPPNFSFVGKLVFWSFIATALAFTAAMMAILHHMVWRFSVGNVFDNNTLKGVRNLGLLLVGFPIFSYLLGHVANYFLAITNDGATFNLASTLDVSTIGAGVFVLALRYVLENAIAIKSENDFTI